MAEKYSLSKPSTAAIIAVSQKVKNELEREYGIEGHLISVIHHGVDPVAFHPTTRERRRAEIRQKLRFAPDDFVVAFVGGDYRLKGLESLIDAARQLPRSLKILTAGVQVDARLRSLIEEDGLRDRITFLGHVNDVATSLFAGADCFALPTRYDTFSLATLEAMASGLPVIVTQAAGVSELLNTHHDSLVLNDPADVAALVQCLRLLLQDGTLRARLGANARETAERHSWNEVARQTMRVYSEAVST
jgi:UDP-glucose:(heptosyl)LPS alpha-1,3-glucosyltransferase